MLLTSVKSFTYFDNTLKRGIFVKKKNMFFKKNGEIKIKNVISIPFPKERQLSIKSLSAGCRGFSGKDRTRKRRLPCGNRLFGKVLLTWRRRGWVSPCCWRRAVSTSPPVRLSRALRSGASLPPTGGFCPAPGQIPAGFLRWRSEERRVGKGCGCRRAEKESRW